MLLVVNTRDEVDVGGARPRTERPDTALPSDTGCWQCVRICGGDRFGQCSGRLISKDGSDMAGAMRLIVALFVCGIVAAACQTPEKPTPPNQSAVFFPAVVDTYGLALSEPTGTTLSNWMPSAGSTLVALSTRKPLQSTATRTSARPTPQSMRSATALSLRCFP